MVAGTTQRQDSMIRYRLTHHTIYSYEKPAIRARHFLHLIPRARTGQTLDTATLTIEPPPIERCDSTDYYGNAITTIEIEAPHSTFRATTEATLRLDRPPPIQTANAAWESIAHDPRLPPDIAEFRLPTRLTGTDETVQACARRHFTPDADIMHATRSLMHDLYAIFRYRPGTTTITTTGPAALAKREGVCQDYTHAMLACLRTVGLPARYISGYLRSQPEADGTTYTGAEQTHAWVSVWLGPTHGWIDFDPTNNLLVTTNHATLAWGRDFTDVSPSCGIILGGGRHRLKATVLLQPV